MMRKNYIRPVTDVVVISPVHIMATSTPEQMRYSGFSIDGEYDETSRNKDASNENYTYNIWQQTGDGFIEID